MNKNADSEIIDEVEHNVGRRKIMYFAGWGIIGLFVVAVLGSTMRFFFPRTIFEPPTDSTEEAYKKMQGCPPERTII